MALLVMAITLGANTNTLRPYAHPNLGLLCRFWLATTLLFDFAHIPMLHSDGSSVSHSPPSSHKPLDQIDWSIHTPTDSGNKKSPSITNCFTPREVQTTRPPPTDLTSPRPNIGVFTSPPQLIPASQPISISNQSTHSQRKELPSTPLPTSVRKVRQHTMHHFLRKQSSPLPHAPDIQPQTSFGHSLEEIDPSKTFRIILQNPNGFSLVDNPTEFSHFLQETASLGAGFIGCVETLCLSHTTRRHPLNPD
jgi:hypothetical protein